MDGIEIEAYGHLFDQFWSPLTNRRTDDVRRRRSRTGCASRWRCCARSGAGSAPTSSSAIRMAIDEQLARTASTRPTGLDDPRSDSPREGLIDFVNVIRGNIVNDAVLSDVIPIHGMASAPHLDFAGMVRAETGLAVFHAAKIDDVATARHAIREGKVDMVGMTRAHMADPHIVRKIQLGRRGSTIRPCVGATYCLDRIYEAGEALCIHNAATGRELTMPHVIEPGRRRRDVWW